MKYSTCRYHVRNVLAHNLRHVADEGKDHNTGKNADDCVTNCYDDRIPKRTCHITSID